MKEIKVHFPELIEKKDWKILKQEINTLELLQIAEIIEDAAKTDPTVLFRLLQRELAKKISSKDLLQTAIESPIC